jgi:hypothetical protein
MERWFWTQGREIGVRIGAVDSGGVIVMPFIGLYDDRRWLIKRREATAVEF